MGWQWPGMVVATDTCMREQLEIDLVAGSCVFSGLANGERRQVDVPCTELWGFVSLYNREAEFALQPAAAAASEDMAAVSCDKTRGDLA
jgi:hypothetical protein